MFGMQILDVAIGLIFIFLLLSLLVTAANELIASWLKRRSSTLWRGVVKLLGGEDWAKKVYSHPLIEGLNDQPWFKKYREKLPFKKRPSYIPSRTFALALIDSIVPESGPQNPPMNNLAAALADRLKANPNDFLARSLSVLVQDAGGDLDKVKENIEVWFNSSMERVSGWYKRRTQWILLLLAAIITVWTNADSLAIANTLWRDPSVRAALVTQAQQYAAQQSRENETGQAASKPSNPTDPPDRLPYDPAEAEFQAASEKFKTSLGSLQTLAIPLGWSDGSSSEDTRDTVPGWSEMGGVLQKHGFGWLLTALAISLGAPFWFDMLNKVISIRAAGKAPEETQKSPKKVPAPREPGSGTPPVIP